MQAVRKRPLFAAALFLSVLILLLDRLPDPFRNIVHRVPANDVGSRAGQSEDSVFLKGLIVSDVETRTTFYKERLSGFILKTENIRAEREAQSANAGGLVKCYLKNLPVPLRYGDEILVRGVLKRPRGLRNPGGFDSRAYLEHLGIRSVFYGDKKAGVEILARRKGRWVYAKALEIRHFLSDRISRGFQGNEAAFLKALFLGERSSLEEDFTDLFIKTGTMHILAVSGFNIGFLCAALFLLLAPFPVPKNWKLGFALLSIWAYCLVVGWQAPVVRASLMASVFFLGQLSGRRTDALNSLGLAACLILLIDPRQIFDIGFQLSFLAVFGLVCFVPVFLRKPELLPHELPTLGERALFYLKEIFWVSFVCALVTLPVTVQNFYIVTPLSVLSNLVVVPISFLLFLAGVLYFLCSAWANPVLSCLTFFMSGLMKLFVASLFAVERIPGAFFIVGKLAWPLLALLVLGISFLLTDKKIRDRHVRAALILLFVSVIFLAQDANRHFNRPFRMTALDVGQGDSIYFEFPDGGNLLVDAGKGGDGDRGRRVIAPFLRSKGVSAIDVLVISHPQEDHIGGLPALFDEFRIRNVVEAGSDYPTRLFRIIQDKIQKEGSGHWTVSQGDRLEGLRGVSVEVLGPDDLTRDARNINNASTVLKLIYGKTSFLLTGDIEKEAMRELLDRDADLRADVLKVPHHGARLAREGKTFVARVHPRFSVISVGEHNPFHHPSPKTLDILSSVPENEILRTDHTGAVEIVSDGNFLSVETLVRS